MTNETDHHDPSWPGVAPADFWEDRYSDADRVWSGNVNRVLADLAATLTPGTALDLGCGEGADVIWLAQHGWRATGVDISPTAIARATETARGIGLTETQARFGVADLSGLADPGPYDLVSASFLHSPVALERTAILRRAAALVAPGGHLLVTSHGAPPPWADVDAHDHRFLSAGEERDELALPSDEWEAVVAESRTREAVSPDGEPATLDDAVLLLRRR